MEFYMVENLLLSIIPESGQIGKTYFSFGTELSACTEACTRYLSTKKSVPKGFKKKNIFPIWPDLGIKEKENYHFLAKFL